MITKKCIQETKEINQQFLGPTHEKFRAAGPEATPRHPRMLLAGTR